MKDLIWTTEKIKVSELMKLDINPRKISENKKKKLADSLEKFNLVEIPAINKDHTIIGGNQRVTALILTGRCEVLLIFALMHLIGHSNFFIHLNPIKMKNFIFLFLGVLTFSVGAIASPPSFSPPDIASIYSPDDCIVQVAQSQIGVREATGNNDGQYVENYLAATGLSKGYAWCAAFVVWTHQHCDRFITASAWSPDLFPAGRTIYHIGNFRLAALQPGDVFGIYFKNKQRIAHVGLVYKWLPGKHFNTIEGNTNGAGSREGDGVYVKMRLKSQIYKTSRWTC